MAKRKPSRSSWIIEDIRSGKFWVFALVIFALPITLLLVQQQQSMQQDAAFNYYPTPKPTYTPYPNKPTPTKNPYASPTLKPNASPTLIRKTPTLRPQPTSGSKTPTPSVVRQVSGIMYVDKNKNGKRDVGEFGFAGGAITVQNMNYQTICKTSTTSSGSYMCKLPTGSGTYRVRLAYPVGYQVVSSNPVTVSISSTQKAVNVNFRLVK